MGESAVTTIWRWHESARLTSHDTNQWTRDSPRRRHRIWNLGVYRVSKDNKNDKIRRIVKQLSLISLTSGLELKTTEWISTILLITPTRQAQDCHAPRQRRPSRSYDGSVPIRWCNLMTVVRPTLKLHLCTCNCKLLLLTYKRNAESV